jgi:hypothetical protein
MSLPLPSKFVENDDKCTLPLSEREFSAESSLKPGNKTDDALKVDRGVIRVPSPDPSLISIDDSNNIRFGRNPDYVPLNYERDTSHSPAPPRTFKGRIQTFWRSNKGLALVLIAQLFGTLMNVTTRMLEMEGNDGWTILCTGNRYMLMMWQARATIRSKFCSLGCQSRSCAHHFICGTTRRNIFHSA